MKTFEVFHGRGCDRVGSIGEFEFKVVDGRCVLPCCWRQLTGREVHADWRLEGLGFGPTTLRHPPDTYVHVEDPEFAQRDAEEQRDKLDGWHAAAMLQYERGRPDVGRSILESVMGHMREHGKVP